MYIVVFCAPIMKHNQNHFKQAFNQAFNQASRAWIRDTVARAGKGDSR